MGVKGRDFRLTDRVAGVFCYQILHNSRESLVVVSPNTRKVISILPDETGTRAHAFAQAAKLGKLHAEIAQATGNVGIIRIESCQQESAMGVWCEQPHDGQEIAGVVIVSAHPLPAVFQHSPLIVLRQHSTRTYKRPRRIHHH